MSNQITPELFQHLVELAALELSPEEAEYLRKELNNQLRAIDELAAIPLDENTPVTSHGVPYTAEMRPGIREDIWEPWQDIESILAQAPKVNNRYIVVPEIPHEALG